MKPSPAQADLYIESPPEPAGLRYLADLISPAEEAELLSRLRALDFKPLDFNGHLANRQVVNYGLRYDYGAQRVVESEPLPDWLAPLRDKAAAFAERATDDFVQVLINEYHVGAGVGWHRDRPQFGEVVGVSLGASCPFRFRLQDGERWVRRTILLEPRSAYLLSGPARHQWQHSIAPVEQHRYSITFRTLNAARQRG